jgi:hypothetical protein
MYSRFEKEVLRIFSNSFTIIYMNNIQYIIHTKDQIKNKKQASSSIYT